MSANQDTLHHGPDGKRRGCCGCGSTAAVGDSHGGTVKDPVCGMKVDPATSKHRLDHHGTTHHFCSAGCQAKFSADPESYLQPKAA